MLELRFPEGQKARRKMSQGISCKIKEHRPRWVVTQRNGNASAFNGYHWTPSDYSAVHCPLCPTAWRTKAKFVNSLPDGKLT